MGEVLGTLNAVQGLDSEIDRLELEETRIPGDLSAAREERTRLTQTLAATGAEHAAVRRAVSAADLELRNYTAQRERYRADQKKAGAKEQTQLENQIQQLSGEIDELENTSLEQVERMERLAAEVERLEGELARLTPRLSELEGMDESRIAALRASRYESARQRAALAGGLDPKLLRDYDSIRKSKKGLGLVPVKGTRCGGCNVQLPVNVLQRVQSGTAVVKCPSCGRILWAG